MLVIFINNHPQPVSPGTNLHQALLANMALEPQVDLANIAAVVNQHIIPKSQWQRHICQHNDHIELFNPVAGG